MFSFERSVLQSFFKLTASNNLKSSLLFNTTRLYSSPACNEVSDIVKNRNPRNLERLRIGRKPTGYHLDKPGRSFWHKVLITVKPRYIIGKVCHSNGSDVIQAATNEWGISKHLYRTYDIPAYIALARVLAERCLESGITEMINGVEMNSEKRKQFIKHFQESGIQLSEADTYSHLTPWSRKVEEKPWTVHIF